MLGGVSPEYRLSHDERKEADAVIRARTRGVNKWLIAGWIGFVVVVAIGLRAHWLWVSPKPQPPVVYDQTARQSWLAFGGAALYASMVPMAMLFHWFDRRALRDRPGWASRYFASVSGIRPARFALLMSVPFLMLVVWHLSFGWSSGCRVDSAGCWVPDGWFSRRLVAFDEIATIDHYSSIRTPRGVVSRDVVRLSLVDGSRIDPEFREPVGAIAEFIAARSKVPVNDAGLRPD